MFSGPRAEPLALCGARHKGAGRLDRAGSELPWLAEPPGMAEPRLQRTGVRSQRGAGGAGPR